MFNVVHGNGHITICDETYGSHLVGGERSHLTGGHRSVCIGEDESRLKAGWDSILDGWDDCTLIAEDGSVLTGGNDCIFQAGLDSVVISRWSDEEGAPQTTVRVITSELADKPFKCHNGVWSPAEIPAS